jgi:hypothetical protein
MSKYSDNSEWCLADGYNTRRGEILDGSRVSPIPSVTWHIGKHCVDDDSIHYTIMKFLKNQPLNKASVRILRALNITDIDHYLRELEKQRICAWV